MKSEFSISDLEQLSGVSAHTIRIWERRFHLLHPRRTGANIRKYGSEDLRKLLNIAGLRQHGLKISAIAQLSDYELAAEIERQLHVADGFESSINTFKVAMFDFDRFLFEKTWEKLCSESSFETVFVHALLPFLNQIGLLWQTGSISPAHEHFISNIIRQKIFVQIEKAAAQKPASDRLYVLFLPLHEVHEIGLLYIHYALLKSGKNSIYLGTDMHSTELEGIKKKAKVPVTFVSYWTLDPGKNTEHYLDRFGSSLLEKEDALWITGGKSPVDYDGMHGKIHALPHPPSLLNALLLPS